MGDQNIELDKYVIVELQQYLRECRHIDGLRRGLYIIFMRYLQHMTNSEDGISDIDSDFFYDFANLLEVLFILRPEQDATDLDDVTHYNPS